MKKIFATLLTLTVATTLSLQAAVVPTETAGRLAQDAITERFPGFDASAYTVKAVSYEGELSYYVVQFDGGGWVLIAADDTSTPLIGYNNTGIFRTEGMPESVESFFNCVSQRIQENRISQPSRPMRSLKKTALTAAKADISPLIQVNWNQTGAYRKYCPSSASAGNAIVGCVAVGMAQAMSVQKYPARPVGSYGYTSANYGSLYIDYDSEPAYNWDEIISGANNKDGAARLLWHCGVSVNMDYGADGSGTQTRYIATALQRNFQYPSSVKFLSRTDYTESEWNDIIYNELANGRAVAFSGYDYKGGYGHCFNLDGYQGGAYSVNWGWGGSNNGYFLLTSLKDLTMGMDYSEPRGQGVVIGIRPPSTKPSDIRLSSTTVEANQPAGTVVGAVEVVSEATDAVYEYTLLGKYNVVLHRRAAAPFKIEGGNLVTTKALTEDQEVTITAKSQYGEYTRTFNISVVTSGIAEITGDTSAAVQYISADGKVSSEMHPGFNIVLTRKADGTVESRKVFKSEE